MHLRRERVVQLLQAHGLLVLRNLRGVYICKNVAEFSRELLIFQTDFSRKF